MIEREKFIRNIFDLGFDYAAQEYKGINLLVFFERL